MGITVIGRLTVGGQDVEVKADFGSDHVTFSGGRRGEVKYADVQVASTTKGILRLVVDGAVMQFPIGDKVDRLAAKIRKPPSRAQKMGIRPGQRVQVDLDDRGLRKEIAALGVQGGAEALDALIVGVHHASELDFPSWASRIHDQGGVWVVYRKGRPDLRERDVLQEGRAAGLRDYRIVRFDEKRTAIKFVWPLVDREPRAGRGGPARRIGEEE